MRHKTRLIFLGIIFILAGCGTVGKDFNAPKAKNIVNGISTQEDIKMIFGKPFKTGVQNGKPIWVYEHNYYHLISDNASKNLIIVFNPNGVVQSHQFMTSETTLIN